MGEPRAKAARPASLYSKLPFVSGRALSALLSLAKKEKLPEATSRRTLQRGRDKDCHTLTPYGPLHRNIEIEDTSGATMSIEVQDPLAMLYQVCISSMCFSSLLQPLLVGTSPTKPLGIIMYCDEVLPGNPLAVKTERKIWAWYWTIHELGQAALSNEDS